MTKIGRRAALIVGLCSSSVAADEREPIRLSYVADARCPSAKDFEASVLERSSRARPAGPRDIAREYRIAVRFAERKSVARLEFADAGGGKVIREVTAGDCAEAVRAIALVTALAFDAVVAAGSEKRSTSADSPLDAQTGAGPPSGEAISSPPTAPAPATDSDARAAPKPEANEPAARRSVAPPSDPARDLSPPFPAAAPSKKPALGFGARGTLTLGKAPSVLPGAELFALLSGARREWSIQIGVAGERGSQFEAGPGKARFSFVGGRLEGCVFPVALSESIELSPCALFEGGAVIVESFIDEPHDVVDPWFALGLNARLAWELGWATALLEAGPLVPLRPEDRVVFENPDQTVHDVPPVGGFASLGLAWRGP